MADPELEAIRARRMQELMAQRGMIRNYKQEILKALTSKMPKKTQRVARMGQIVEKVSEDRLISLLEQTNTQTSKQPKITIRRRYNVLEDDD